MRLRLTMCFIVLIGCIVAVEALGERIVNLDFEPPSTLEPHSTSGDYRAYWLLRNAHPEITFDFIIDTLQSDPNGTVELKAGSGKNGSYGLDISIEPTEVSAEADRDRFEMRPVHGNGSIALEYGQVRYFGYAVYIDPSNPMPVEYAHMSQCWQRPTESLEEVNVNAVPMWMSLIEYQGGFGWSINVKNEGEADSEGYYTGQSSNVGMGAFEPGWNTVIMRLEPNHKYSNDDANFTVWINETREEHPTAQSSFPWGSTPDSDPPPAWEPLTGMSSRFDVRCGVYRRKQNVSIHLIYDNVRYGETFNDVVPTCQYTLDADINKDCVVDLLDLAGVSAQWLKCTDPEFEGCVETLREMQ
jgi:hypothetical protein